MTTYYFSIVKKNNDYKENQISITNVVNKIKSEGLAASIDVDSLAIKSGPKGSVNSNDTQDTVKTNLNKVLNKLNAQVGKIQTQPI
jgi:hypothetical protein